LTPPPFTVRIIDQSADSEDNVVEDIGPFETVEAANVFARRYVRDSMERCRAQGMSAKDVLDAWFAFGEDATVPDAAEHGWTSAAELAGFSEQRAKSAERDWRSIDPRLNQPSGGLSPSDLLTAKFPLGDLPPGEPGEPGDESA